MLRLTTSRCSLLFYQMFHQMIKELVSQKLLKTRKTIPKKSKTTTLSNLWSIGIYPQTLKEQCHLKNCCLYRSLSSLKLIQLKGGMIRAIRAMHLPKLLLHLKLDANQLANPSLKVVNSLLKNYKKFRNLSRQRASSQRTSLKTVFCQPLVMN